jgi:hypothetical protein
MTKSTRILMAVLMAGAVGLTAAPSLAEQRGDRGPGYKMGQKMASSGWREGHGGSRSRVDHWRSRGGPGGGFSMTLIERFDTNKDGTISRQEIATVSTDRIRAFDTNADGKLSLAEFTALWTDTMKLQIVRAFQERDPDGDAIVTLEEYSAPFDRMLARFDRNNDGMIDPRELGGRGGDHGPRPGPDAPANPPPAATPPAATPETQPDNG